MQKLFLASKGTHPVTLEKLQHFIGGSFSGKTIAYIPTAANGKLYGRWKMGDSIRRVQNLGTTIKIVELEDYYYRNVKQELQGVDIIWVSGGMTGYLLYWMRRVELNHYLPDLLETGTVYVGSSAGSMALSPTNYASEIFVDDNEPGAGSIPGLGLIDFEIYPHYRDELLEGIKHQWLPENGKLYLLRDGDVITKVGEKVEVLGEEIILN